MGARLIQDGKYIDYLYCHDDQDDDAKVPVEYRIYSTALLDMSCLEVNKYIGFCDSVIQKYKRVLPIRA